MHQPGTVPGIMEAAVAGSCIPDKHLHSRLDSDPSLHGRPLTSAFVRGRTGAETRAARIASLCGFDSRGIIECELLCFGTSERVRSLQVCKCALFGSHIHPSTEARCPRTQNVEGGTLKYVDEALVSDGPASGSSY